MKNNYCDTFHPVSLFIYAFSLIIMSIIFFNPYLIATSILLSLVNALIFSSKKAVFKSLIFISLFSLVVAVFNPLVSHNGKTTLFYFFSQPFTLEALFYGACSGCMIISVVLWFILYNELVSPEKFLFIFSRFAPAFSMVVTMTQRFIPLLKNRLSTIRAVQSSLTQNVGKLKTSLKETSILLSWSMEEGLETADSMRARGYGLKSRSSYSVYKFNVKDTVLICFTLLLFIISITAFYLSPKIKFYPSIKLPTNIFSHIALISFILLGSLMPILQIIDNLKWKLRS